MDLVVVVLIVLVVAAVLILAFFALRSDPGRRGSDPGKGYHELRSDYQYGVGGGHVTTWKVPKDPQEYAKRFIPKDRQK